MTKIFLGLRVHLSGLGIVQVSLRLLCSISDLCRSINARCRTWTFTQRNIWIKDIEISWTTYKPVSQLVRDSRLRNGFICDTVQTNKGLFPTLFKIAKINPGNCLNCHLLWTSESYGIDLFYCNHFFFLLTCR